MRTQTSVDIQHLQERLARLEKRVDKIAAQVGNLVQNSQIASQMPALGGGTFGLYAELPSGQTLPAGTSNGMVMGDTATVVLCGNSGGTLVAGSTTITVYNVAGAVTGPAALVLLPMVDGSYTAIVAPCQ